MRKSMGFALAAIAFLSFSSVNLRAQTARLQVIHNAADPAAASVDVYLNGGLLLDNFGFRTATPFIDAPAGTPINVGIAPGTSSSANETLKNFNLTLTPGETYVAIANGVLNPANFAANPDGRSPAFTLFIKSLARETGSDPGKVDFFAVHGASDAPAVDVIARGVAPLVDNAAYGDITDYLSVPAAAYTLDITPGNDNSVIVASFDADLSGLGGGSAVVLASGFLDPATNQNGQGFGLIAVLATGDVVNFGIATSAPEQKWSVPAKLELLQNYPKPFNPSTTIEFRLQDNTQANLKVYDITGREVAELINKKLAPGSHSINFSGADLASGVYHYRLATGSLTLTKKMSLVK